VLEVAIAYHERAPLQSEEWSLLGVLVAARLLMTVVIHEWHVQHNPESGHFQPLAAELMQARLAIAAELLLEEIRP
jgi:Ser/Thr protein kinase RdoA (MazF antagonist)